MKRFFYFLLFLLLTGCERCDDIINPKTELEKLPPATQEGKSTFGCLVNGKAWVTRTSTDALAVYQSSLLQVSAGADVSNRQEGMILVVSDDIVVGSIYNLAKDVKTKVEFSSRNSLGICFYERQDALDGHLKITKLDQVNLIVSGLFEFTTVVSGCDTIKVTDGRFDLLYAN